MLELSDPARRARLSRLAIARLASTTAFFEVHHDR